jgi:Raf kinase inhibitor-like YbhB/YbcL family protein
MPWTHWVAANIPPDTKRLPEGFYGGDRGPEQGGMQEGVNDWKQPGWQGPVPTSQGHRVQFRLYALDDELKLGNKVRIRFHACVVDFQYCYSTLPLLLF